MGVWGFVKTQFVVHLLIGFVFVISGLIINFLQLCTLPLWGYNKQLYRRINCRLSYSLWSRKLLAAVCGGMVGCHVWSLCVSPLRAGDAARVVVRHAVHTLH